MTTESHKCDDGLDDLIAANGALLDDLIALVEQPGGGIRARARRDMEERDEERPAGADRRSL